VQYRILHIGEILIEGAGGGIHGPCDIRYAQFAQTAFIQQGPGGVENATPFLQRPGAQRPTIEVGDLIGFAPQER